MYEALKRLACLTGQEEHLKILHRMTSNDSDTRPRLGRLAFLPEPGGKTRVIAIGDYFSQQVLKPLHEHLMEILRGMKTDGT